MKHFFESYVLPVLTGAGIGGILFTVVLVIADLEHANERATNAALAEAAKHLEGGSHGL